ncbi:MAG: Bro-N domain-containing protein [Deltaproteobacteria bacterium]|jgi:prophage antirepressor-like protein|nr:Bro-N domain-containing protein [Deltaproteobacteria bacterium]
MSIELIPFVSERFGELRTCMRDGEPLFCGVDACRVMELANPNQVMSSLDDDEKTTIYSGVANSDANDGLTLTGRARSMVFVSEPGLCSPGVQVPVR